MAAGNGAKRSDRITPRFGPVASLRCAPGCHSSHTCYRPVVIGTKTFSLLFRRFHRDVELGAPFYFAGEVGG